jgi:hypothetical protein
MDTIEESYICKETTKGNQLNEKLTGSPNLSYTKK